MRVSEGAILNANYLREKLKDVFQLAVNEPCLHEFVLTLKKAAEKGIHAGDVGKRLLDFGFHAPTVHFPLVVAEALMIEPTETESRETLDLFVEAMKRIAFEIENEPDKVKNAPFTLPVRRPNDVLAARRPILTYRDLCRAKTLRKLSHESTWGSRGSCFRFLSRESWLRWPLTTRAPDVLEAVANPQRADVTADGAR